MWINPGGVYPIDNRRLMVDPRVFVLIEIEGTAENARRCYDAAFLTARAL